MNNTPTSCIMKGTVPWKKLQIFFIYVRIKHLHNKYTLPFQEMLLHPGRILMYHV
jgi:hypothetical protein